ncbi:MAG: hypothetical protein COB60_11190 [Flavobacteriaceae bacterium]|nr:MAG: hypothetical protein COB60_11190 [Flavobacteriaceae bacterium]
MKRCYKFLLLILLYTGLTQAQEILWEIDLKEKLYHVGWIEQTNDGLILAAGAKGLVALDNNTGETKWHNEDLKSIDKNSFRNIANLPMFYIEYSPLLGKKRGLLMNSNTGKILYDTKEEGYRIKNFTSIPEQGIILFELLKEKTMYLMKFSLKTWQEDWIVSLGKKPKSGLLKKIMAFESSSFLDHTPQFGTHGNMIVGVGKHIYVINSTNGNMEWQYEAKNKIKALVYSSLNNNLYVGIKKSNKLIIFNPQTGENITPGKLKLRGYMLDLVKDKAGNLILVESEGFNIINPESNTFRWKKSFKIEPLTEVIPLDDGNFIAIGKDDKDGIIAKVNADGKKIWDAKVKGYAYYINLTDKGVLYISTERSNILDFEKGKDLWKKDVKFKAIPAVTYDTDEQKVVIFENKKAYKFDLNTGDIDLFAEDISLEKVSRKTPVEAEYIKDKGYFLFSDQHLSLISKDGVLEYTNYYTPPSSNDALFALGNLAGAYFGVDLDIKGAIQNINKLTDISNGVYTNTLDQNGAREQTNVSGLYVGTNSSNMQAVFEVSNTRYFNSKQTKNHQFVVTKVKSDTAPTKHVIYMIDKGTGKIEKEVDLLDKTPNYLVDDVDNRVFINQKNQLISCYKF